MHFRRRVQEIKTRPGRLGAALGVSLVRASLVRRPSTWRVQADPAYGRLGDVAVDREPCGGPSASLFPCAPSPHQRERRAGHTPWMHAPHMPLARWPLAWPARAPWQLAVDLVVHIVLMVVAASSFLSTSSRLLLLFTHAAGPPCRHCRAHPSAHN
jgi:hypothetical protein